MATVKLWNRNWQNGVNVDVRVGSFTNPTQNAPYWAGRVVYQSAVTIDTADTTIWRRRDLDPDHPTNPPSYGEWVSNEVFEADIEDTI